MVELTLDYYNSSLTFRKNVGEDDDEDMMMYEMPVKTDQGDIYPFVSLGVKDS